MALKPGLRHTRLAYTGHCVWLRRPSRGSVEPGKVGVDGPRRVPRACYLRIM
jgi:hypothetical protein